MMMLTKKNLEDLPGMYSQESIADPQAVVKFFTPDASWTWYAIEYEPEEKMFFGLVDGQCKELGYFSLAELESARGPLGLKIERDYYFNPTPISKLWPERSAI